MGRNKLAPVLAVIGGALVLVVALVVASQTGKGSDNKPSSTTIELDSIEEMLSGVPQKGITLGNPKAKLTLIEFTDPQCPWCGKWAREVFPSLIEKYVRTGKLRVEYSGLAYLGDDSTRILRLALAAGLQNKLWNVVELAFENQGSENTGYVTDPFLRGLVEAVPDLDADKALLDAYTSAVVPLVEAAKVRFEKYFGDQLSTPSFVIEREGSTEVEKIGGFQPLENFVEIIEAQLKK